MSSFDPFRRKLKIEFTLIKGNPTNWAMIWASGHWPEVSDILIITKSHYYGPT